MFQPPVTLPTLLPASSTTKSFQTPFATDPFNDDSLVPVGPPAGAGAGNVSPGSKSVGRKEPDVSAELSGMALGARSSNARLRLLAAVDPPTSDIRTTVRPLGLCSRMSTSSGDEWLKFV